MLELPHIFQLVCAELCGALLDPFQTLTHSAEDGVWIECVWRHSSLGVHLISVLPFFRLPRVLLFLLYALPL